MAQKTHRLGGYLSSINRYFQADSPSRVLNHPKSFISELSVYQYMLTIYNINPVINITIYCPIITALYSSILNFID